MTAPMRMANGVDAPAILSLVHHVMRAHTLEEVGESHAVVQSYRDLVEVLKDRRKAMRLTHLDLDARAGWSEGMTAKLENWDKGWGRGAGPKILPLWLESLGMAMVLIEKNPAPPKRLRDPRQLEMVLPGGTMNAVQLVGKGATRTAYRR